MALPLVFRRGVAQDLADAYRWYEFLDYARGEHLGIERASLGLPESVVACVREAAPTAPVAAECGLAHGSTGPATAGPLGPAWGARYIVSVRAKASCFRGPVGSNVGLCGAVRLDSSGG
jgi:hypothetical protein